MADLLTLDTMLGNHEQVAVITIVEVQGVWG